MDLSEPTVDSEAFAELMRRVEADRHRDGWDQPARIYVVYDWDHPETDAMFRRFFSSRCGRPVRWRPYIAHPIAIPEAMSKPSVALYLLANNLRNHAAGTMLPGRETLAAATAAMLRQPGVVGVAMCVEAWARKAALPEGHGPDEADAREAALAHLYQGRKSLADVPGSVENRIMVGVDITGQECTWYRVRGGKPTRDALELGDLPEGEPHPRANGAVIESLRMIADFIAGRPMAEPEFLPTRWDEYLARQH